MVFTGTFWRTFLAIVISINTALMATDITQFNNPTLEMIYRIVSVVLNFIIIALNTYFNNDYTKEAFEGTGYTRLLKRKGKEFVDIKEEITEEVIEEDE